MKFSTNTRYAIRILFELKSAARPLAIAALSERIGLTSRTVENIHAILKQNGITDGSVGAHGGIFLKEKLENISLGRMILIFDGGIFLEVCYGDKANECPRQEDCAISKTWGIISKTVQAELDKIKLSDILNQYPANACLLQHYTDIPLTH